MFDPAIPASIRNASDAETLHFKWWKLFLPGGPVYSMHTAETLYHYINHYLCHVYCRGRNYVSLYKSLFMPCVLQRQRLCIIILIIIYAMYTAEAETLYHYINHYLCHVYCRGRDSVSLYKSLFMPCILQRQKLCIIILIIIYAMYTAEAETLYHYINHYLCHVYCRGRDSVSLY